VACQVPLHRSPVMMPLQLPEPELPINLPLPLATERPTEIRTETLPAELIPPVTLPPPAEKRRPPETVKGALLLARQLPARVKKTTFQVPS
jgi:hypothetical protein